MKKIIIKKDLYNTLIMLMSIVLSFFIILITDNIIIHISSFLILSLVSLIIVKFDFNHPFTWYAPLFTMYSISHPVLLLVGDSRIDTYSKELMLLQLAGLATFLIIVSPKKIDSQKLSAIFTKMKDFTYINKYIYFFLFIFLVASSLYISQLGHKGKNELYGLGSPIVYLTFRLILVFLIIYSIGLIKRAKNNKRKLSYIIVSSIPVVLLFLYSGERDLVLRFILITFYVLYTFDILVKNKSNLKYILLSVVSILMLPVLAAFKYIGLERGVNEKFFEDFLTGFFRSDFIAASTNLQILIDNNMGSYFSGYTLYSNIMRSLDIFNFRVTNDFSSGKWFDNYFYSHTETGMGFTLVGDGYINFGIYGVIVVFLIISLIIRFLYHSSSKSFLYYLIYLFTIPIYIYAIRGDLSTLLSPLLKQIILAIVIINFTNYIIMHSTYQKNISK